LISKHLLSGTTDASVFLELLSNHSVLIERAADLLCCAANGSLCGELLADAADCLNVRTCGVLVNGDRMLPLRSRPRPA